ncbi:YjiH family protein [Alteromonas gilva]|uniref:Nucleoside recognition domain-containing protein n=1 Tax=Alteromonas gilva TaxID=2987522 RepID=A0ABT5L4Y3_9ALTE|nr:nucleoside recognition domain-containing protein [Alteromonas gilva]MDC8831928.1 nucleoside recognition domain-containing protein [Alteromonas gilva]
MSNNEQALKMQSASSTTMTWVKLLGCSLFGILFFLTPMYIDGAWTIALGILTGQISDWLGENMGVFTTSCFVLAAVVSVIYNVSPRHMAMKLPMADRLIASHWLWVVVNVSAAVMACMTLFQIGPQWLISAQTGVTAYIDVAGAIFLLVGLGCLLLPFLTDYGLLEFVGTMLQRPFQKLFNLPGRASIDTVASWVGSSSIAVVLTNAQYEKGYYSGRESSVIATNFSVVSVPFVLLTANVAGLGDYFLQLYGSMFVICTLCAVITPRLPPLCWVKNDYYPPNGKTLNEDVDHGESRLKMAMSRAYAVAEKSPAPKVSLQRGWHSMMDIYLMMMPAAMTIELFTLAIYYHSSLFQTLTYPLSVLLELMQIPEARAAAPGLILGLFDQFVPTIIASELTSLKTKFVLAGLSVTQLIFFAESAILIMRSSIPLSVRHLVAIFAIRTCIALPLLTLIAHLLF